MLSNHTYNKIRSIWLQAYWDLGICMCIKENKLYEIVIILNINLIPDCCHSSSWRLRLTWKDFKLRSQFKRLVVVSCGSICFRQNQQDHILLVSAIFEKCSKANDNIDRYQSDFLDLIEMLRAQIWVIAAFYSTILWFVTDVPWG